MNPKIALLKDIYEAFNVRDGQGSPRHAATSRLAQRREGGRLTGHPAVRAYWLRQWKEIRPTVTPRGYEELPDGRILVRVNQHVVDPNGTLLADLMVHHVYTFENELVLRMDIEDAP